MKRTGSLAVFLMGVVIYWGGTTASRADTSERDFQKAAKDIQSLAGRVVNAKGFAAMQAIVRNAAVPISYRARGLLCMGKYVLKWKTRPPDPRKAYVEALGYCTQAERMLPQIASLRLKVAFLLELAECYDRLEKPDRAVSSYDRARKFISHIDQPAQRIALHIELATGYSKLGRVDKARACCSDAMTLVEKTKPARKRLPWLIRLAELYSRLRDTPGVLRTAPAAHALCIDAGDLDGQAKCLLLMGQAHEREKDLEEAVTTYLRAAELENNWDGYAAAARCLISAGKTEKSFRLLKTAVARDPVSAPGYAATPTAAAKAEAKAYFDGLSKAAAELVKNKKSEQGCHVLRVATCFVGRRAGCLDRAAEAQTDLVTALLLERKREQAVAEAKRYFALCNIRNIGSAIDVAARALKAADGDINHRVKAFLEYQRHGPAGKDKKPGTSDDLQDPLEKTKLGAPKEHELLDALTAALPATDHRARGYAFLLKGNTTAALCEFRCAYASAGGANLTDAIYDVATAIKATDGHVLRANRYLIFQKYGPAGQDGKQGTADDLEDPLGDMPWVIPPVRLKTTETQIAQCGSDYAGLRRKGYLLLSTGRPQEALKIMREAYDLCDIDVKALQTAIMDVAAAIKAVDGHVFRANQYLLFQKYGTAGKDGAKGTKDDLVNPLASASPRRAEKTG